jgi:hypothetical protein
MCPRGRACALGAGRVTTYSASATLRRGQQLSSLGIPDQRAHPLARAFRIVGMTARALQAGDRIWVGGRYDYEVEWMAVARGDFGYPGSVSDFEARVFPCHLRHRTRRP